MIHICAVTFGCHGRWLLPLLLLHILTAEVVSGKPNRCDYEQLSPDEDNNNRADSKKSGKNKSERHRRFGSIDDDNGNSSQEEEDEDSGNQKRIRPPPPPHPSLYPVLLASSYHDAITKDDEGDLPKLPSSPFPHETDQDDDDEEIDRLTCWVCERAFR